MSLRHSAPAFLLLGFLLVYGQISQHSSAPAQEDAAPATAPSPVLKAFVEELVAITPGQGKFPKTFRMGSPAGAATELPAREVTLTGDFSISKYEVPQNLYEAVTGQNPSQWKGARNSAEMFSWNEAAVFCQKLTAQLREAKLIDAGEEIRLPTEAEWEYCCRAGTETAYSFGDSATGPNDQGPKASLLDPYGWHTGNAAGNDPAVGELKPNPWGLHDMHGYLWEFTADAWHPSYEGAPADSSAWNSERPATARVIRGGSWRDAHPAHRSASREPFRVEARSDAVGLRCVKAAVPARP